jgi:phage terminase large subunit
MKARLDEYGVEYDTRESPLIEITLKRGGHRIVFSSTSFSSGSRSEERMKKYTDARRVLINEVTAVPRDVYVQIKNRMGRSWDDAQMMVTFNPVSDKHWCVQDWVLPTKSGIPIEDTLVIHSTHLDNPELSDSARKRMLDEGRHNPNFQRVYVEGEPGVLEGLVYIEGENWSVVEDEEWPAELDGITPSSAGVDFGFGTNASVATWLFNDAYYVREIQYLHEKRQEECRNDLADVFLRNGWPKRVSMRCDHEVDRIEDLKINGGFPNAIEAYKDVNLGIEQVMERHVHIHASSQNLIKEMRSYKWDDRTVAGDLDRKPVKGYDHAVDALRYSIAYKQVVKPTVHRLIGSVASRQRKF